VSRALNLLLQAALFLATLNTILFGVRVALQQGLGIGGWYWGGAVAVFIAPPALALALFLFDRINNLGASRSNNA
jgi:hypothetical protein